MTDLTVVQYAQIAARVYDDPPQIGAADGPARARMYPGGILAFRGTDNPQSMLTDANIVAADSGVVGQIHGGFWGAYELIRDDLAKLHPSVIIGHSLGAALALIDAGVRCRSGSPPTAVYCFEPPRLCLDATLRGLLEMHGVMTWACRNAIDPVPEVPPWMSLPVPLSQIGTFNPSEPDPIFYHLIENVIRSLSGAAAAQPKGQ